MIDAGSTEKRVTPMIGDGNWFFPGSEKEQLR
jgi:hypothetical protein